VTDKTTQRNMASPAPPKPSPPPPRTHQVLKAIHTAEVARVDGSRNILKLLSVNTRRTKVGWFKFMKLTTLKPVLKAPGHSA